MEEYKTRTEIPEKYKWDLSDIYPDMTAFEADFEKAKSLVADFPKHEKTMSESAQGLYDMLCEQTLIDRIISKLFEYAFLNSDLNKADNRYLALEGKVQNLACDAGAAAYFVSPAILRLDPALVEKWFCELPSLSEYRRRIELEQRFRPHTLSDECEKLLADMQNGLNSHSEIHTVFANADLTFGKIRNEEGKTVELTEATYVPRLMSENRRVRRAAFCRLYETYKKFGNTFSSLMNAYVKERVALSKIRKFNSSLEASVFGDEVTPDIYNNLIATVSENMDVLFKYYDLKKQVLGLSQMHMYDIYTPLIASCTKEYSFEEACREVLDAVSVFGEEYRGTLQSGIEEHRWVDVYPTKGKSGGAYSAGCYDTQPYILLNYTGKLDDVSTLAHEAGHSMHSYFSAKNNTPQESQYTIFVAEVASTVNELIFSHKKLRESPSREEKLSILNQIMETYKGTLYRQTMFAEFEKEMHELSESGETLTQDLLCERYYTLIKKYFGNHVVCDKQIACEWMRIPHFYRWFYVYKYATCISAASSIVHRIETEGKEYIGKYLDFLRLGGSRSPLESLKVADIDMTSPNVVKDSIADFSAAIDMFSEIYNSK